MEIPIVFFISTIIFWVWKINCHFEDLYKEKSSEYTSIMSALGELTIFENLMAFTPSFGHRNRKILILSILMFVCFFGFILSGLHFAK